MRNASRAGDGSSPNGRDAASMMKVARDRNTLTMCQRWTLGYIPWSRVHPHVMAGQEVPFYMVFEELSLIGPLMTQSSVTY